MPTQEQVLEALKDVQDPEIHKSIVELNMVKDIRIDGSKVSVTIALTIRGCPLRDEIRRLVTERLLEMDGVNEADVTLTEMTPEERQALFGGDKLQKAPLLAPDSPTQVIGVASGKGGVGKSTVTVNLAAAMRRLGYSVGVLDADIYGFSVPRMLGVSGKPTAIEGKIMPMPAYGLKVISMGNFVDNNAPVIWRGPMLGKVLQQFLTDVLWGDLDYLLLDLPPGTGDMALDVARMLPRSRMLIVTTPQTVASGVASRAAHMAAKANQQVIGVVENMSHFVCPDCGRASALFGEGGGRSLAEELGVELLAQIPLTLALREGSDRGIPIVFQDGTEADPARRAIEDLARKVAAACPVPARR
ncbi:MAG: Mrp/NBP35 family ATP-binding protein [Firmicutes bacterium]|nr:Mrp/NBP35 family ATP-binding protein [Bacillota bacterium]